jgi:hypothetical protein
MGGSSGADGASGSSGVGSAPEWTLREGEMVLLVGDYAAKRLSPG